MSDGAGRGIGAALGAATDFLFWPARKAGGWLGLAALGLAAVGGFAVGTVGWALSPGFDLDMPVAGFFSAVFFAGVAGAVLLGFAFLMWAARCRVRRGAKTGHGGPSDAMDGDAANAGGTAGVPSLPAWGIGLAAMAGTVCLLGLTARERYVDHRTVQAFDAGALRPEFRDFIRLAALRDLAFEPDFSAATIRGLDGLYRRWIEEGVAAAASTTPFGEHPPEGVDPEEWRALWRAEDEIWKRGPSGEFSHIHTFGFVERNVRRMMWASWDRASWPERHLVMSSLLPCLGAGLTWAAVCACVGLLWPRRRTCVGAARGA